MRETKVVRLHSVCLQYYPSLVSQLPNSMDVPKSHATEEIKAKDGKLMVKLNEKEKEEAKKMVDFSELCEKNKKLEKMLLDMTNKCEKNGQDLAKKEHDLSKKDEEIAEIGHKLMNLTSRLEERVRCPVCLDVPTSGPVYACPKGHCVCSSCYQGFHSQCPLCRNQMYQTTSLLAVTVIENIDHVCPHEGCTARVPANKIEDHMKSCDLRPVSCPSHRCEKTVPYSKLLEHIKSSCKSSQPKMAVQDSQYSRTVAILEPKVLSENFVIIWLEWKNMHFFLTFKGEGNYRNFYVEMLGSEKDYLNIL